MEIVWFLGRNVAMVGAVGAEMAFGVTDIFVEQSTNGTPSQELKGDIPVLRAIAELGVRFQF
jgi:hypothetical protein